MSNASKGKRWERHFVNTLDDLCLPAYRVPGSGARRGYKTDGQRKALLPDDVVVADEWRVEVKYRTNGSGFVRLNDWVEQTGSFALALPESGLVVMRVELWADLCSWRLKEDNRDLSVFDYNFRGFPSPGHMSGCHIPEKSVAPQKTLLGWIGDADALAVKKRSKNTNVTFPWLVLERYGP